MPFEPEKRICQNCGKEFVIEPEDFKFYQKINVPPPTFCPDCRLQRRMSWINERKLYKRSCDFSGEKIISIFSKNVPFPVYHYKIWWSDKWDPMEYGRDYDFNKPFFEQFKELRNSVPRYNLTISKSVNCEYCPKITQSKNCYMTIGFLAENCLYGTITRDCRDCVDYFSLWRCDFCYENIYCSDCRNVSFAQYAVGCRDSAFLYDCKNCNNCLGCVGLRNKEYHIFNKPCSPEEYNRFLEKYDMGSFANLTTLKKKFFKFNLRFPKRYAMIFRSTNTFGNDIRGAKNCYACFDADALKSSIEDCKYIVTATNIKDSYDMIQCGEGSELCYESCTSWGYRILFSLLVQQSYDVSYSDMCFNSSNLFGCVGLRHKSYCILNKQYTKEEYERLVPKIIEHMNKMPYVDKKGRVYKYGEFFPIELSPFSYNETIAQEYFPLTKEKAIEQGYSWYEKPKSEYKPTIKAKDLPDHIKDVKDSITKEIIECASCAKASEDKQNQCQGSGVYRILPQELEFYRKMNLPLPRLCPDCRHYERIKQRNPLKLYKRKCDKCGKEILTTYSPDRPEIVYCEKCYLKEIG